MRRPVSGIVGFFTNFESNLVGLPPVLMGGFLLMLVWIEDDNLQDQAGWMLSGATAWAAIALIDGIFVRNYWVATAVGVRSFALSPSGAPLLSVWGTSLLISLLGLIGSIAVARRGMRAGFGRWPTLSGAVRFLDESRLTSLTWLMIILCGSVAFYGSAARWRVEGIGPFYADTALVQVSGVKFFDGFKVAPRAARVVKQIGSVVGSKNRTDMRVANEPIFFGPRMEFAYAAFGIQPPRNMPVWWHPGSSFPQSMTREIVERFIAQRFKTCVFLLDPSSDEVDFTRLPDGIVQELSRSYRRTDYTDITVFDRK